MRLRATHQTCGAWTLIELIVVIASLAVFLALFAIAFPESRRKAANISCANNQMQMGLSFRIWEGDHFDRYPMSVSVTNGGAMDAIAAGNPVAVFQVMSNELSTPMILFCPADKSRGPAKGFNTLTSSNISYFFNLSASESSPQDLMSGDDNFEIAGVPVKPGLLEITVNMPLTWSAARHKSCANVGLSDGSVQGMNNSILREWLSSTNFMPMRLAIP